MAHPLLGAVTPAWASRSFSAQSAQHTSTVLPPISTLTVSASRTQSQAAQVLSVMTFSPSEAPDDRGASDGPHRGRTALSDSLATCGGAPLTSREGCGP